MDPIQQYIRAITLVVFGNSLDGLDLSQLRIKFAVKSSDSMIPNTADIRVYNLDPNTAQRIKKEFKTVILQAGFEGNYGVIFKGNIKQVIIGRESATDTFIDIVAGDGDRAYNFAVVNQSLAAGSSQSDQVNAAISSMTPKGVTKGYTSTLPQTKLPRGKVMFGPAREFLQNVADNSDASVSIQNEKVVFIPKKSYLPGQAVAINETNGMVGSPQQTNVGVNVKCLVNPKIAIGGRIQLNNSSIQALKINLDVKSSADIAKSIAAPLNADGVYYVLVMEHQGDTRGVEWYTSLICLNIAISTNPRNSVQVP